MQMWSHSRWFVSVMVLAVTMALATMLASTPRADAAPAPGHDKIPSAVPPQTPAVNNGKVFGITQVGNTVVVGGSFTSVNGVGGAVQTRNYLFGFNAGTGALSSSFAPNINGVVNDVIPGPTANTVYVGGSFSQVNGTAARNVALLNVSTGQLVGTFRAAALNGAVNALATDGDRLYVGGNFTTAGGSAHGGLVALNLTTGAVDGYVGNNVSVRHNDSGSGAQGAVGVRDLDVSADGSRMVAIGNFKRVDGLDRDQVALFTLGASSSAVTADWKTNRYKPYCFNWAFDTYVRGVSFSPDGSYLVIAATGGHNPGTLCDTAARFETHATGSDIQPTWVNYSGGDTLWAITATEKAVFVGGHQRWMNNSLASDYAGPGAVPRPGLAALNTETGMPIKWNPGRNPRGAAVYAFHATPDGLWLGSDTEYIGNRYQYKRPRLAFFPLASGAPEASDATAGLPGTAYLGAPSGGGGNGNVLYRVNAGGPVVGSVDAGPDWEADDGFNSAYRNSGSNAAGWSPGATTDATVPAGTPNAVFDSERWSPSDDPAMKWAFPVAAGLPLKVRLYFANRCSCTNTPGSRQFDVAVEGTKVLDNLDLVAPPMQDQMGTMREYDVTSDGMVNIDFSHEVENPLINAIEIIRTDVPPPTPGSSVLRASQVTTTGAAPATTVDPGGVDWTTVRGAFLAGGKLFYGRSNGTFNSRTFNNGSFGSEQRIDPYNDPAWAGRSHGSGGTYDGSPTSLYAQLSSVTGMAYARGRLYYTLSGNANLYWRWFNADSGAIGADTFTANGGRNWSDTGGMFIADDRLYFVTRSNGNLNSIALTNGTPGGSVTLLDGPGAGGNNWSGRALFLDGTAAPPPNNAPAAEIDVSCTDLVCQFDASGSTDEDGVIESFAWEFGDGASEDGQQASHTYAAAGTYQVTLTVTDDDDATDVATRNVTVTVTSTPPASQVDFVDVATSNSNRINPSVEIPAGTEVGDTLVLTAALNSADQMEASAGWKLLSHENTAGLDSAVWTKKATQADLGGRVTVTMGRIHKVSLIVAAYRGVDADDPIATYAVSTDAATAQHTTPQLTVPAGSWVISYWAEKSPSTTSWTPPPDAIKRADVFSTGGGRVSGLLTDTGAATSGVVPGSTATADTVSSRGINWSIALRAE